jgi:alpha-amylase
MNVAALGGNEIAINKAPMFSVLSNRGASSGNVQISVSAQQSGFAANDAVVDVLTCESMTVNSSGDLSVTIANGAPRVFLKNSDKGSLCGSTTTSSTPQGGAIKQSGAGVGLIAAFGAVMAMVL